MKTLNFIKLASVLVLFFFMSITLSAQTSVKISSKAICASTVTVTWFNPGVFPNTQSVTVSVPAFSNVFANCPSCSGSEWVLCSFEVSFADGSGMNFPGPGCSFTPSYTGPFDCFNSGSGFYDSGRFSYFYIP